MAGLTPILTTALPVAGGLINTTARSSDSQSAREYEARVRQEEQQRSWAHEEEVRQREAAEAATERQAEMDRYSQYYREQGDQLRQDQGVEETDAAADTAERLAAAERSAAEAEAQRQTALTKAQSATRARLAAAGVSADGSGDAYLGGLAGEAAKDIAVTEADLGQTRRTATQTFDSLKRRNLLEQSQLAERQRLDFLTRFG
jgi:colicin import membrane protein